MGKTATAKAPANDAKADNKKAAAKTKKPVAPPQFVSLARCITRLKKELNTVKETELSTFKDNNKKYFNELGDLIKSKQGKTADEKKDINVKIQNLKKQNKASEEYYNIKKNLYRVTNSATAYTATVVEYVVTELLTHGIHSTLRDTKSQKAPKVVLSRYTSDENKPEVLRLTSVPLINSLTSFKNIDKIGVDKDDSAPAEPSEGSTKKQSPLYDTLITKRFKNLCQEVGNGERKLCCSVTVKTLISNIIVELIDHFAKELRIVVGKLSKTKTITDVHIKGSIELSFLFNNSSASYDDFIAKVDESHKNSQILKQGGKAAPTK